MPIHFDLVSPERRIASEVTHQVVIPAIEGDMTVMEGHAPTVTSLREGILRTIGEGKDQSYRVSGGFAEITGSGVIVLAEQGSPLDETTHRDG